MAVRIRVSIRVQFQISCRIREAHRPLDAQQQYAAAITRVVMSPPYHEDSCLQYSCLTLICILLYFRLRTLGYNFSVTTAPHEDCDQLIAARPYIRYSAIHE